MSEFWNTYVAIAGPAIITSLIASAIVYLILGGRDFRLPLGRFWRVAGFGVIASMLVAASMAITGNLPSSATIPYLIGGFTGVVAPILARRT
jgi:hypothetical protein